MKKIIWPIITWVTLTLVTWLVAILLQGTFMEYFFLVAVVGVAMVAFFQSSGGVFTNSISAEIQGETGMKQQTEKIAFQPTIVFFASIIYFIVATLATIFYYFL
ncbi:hypothetical protein KO561_14245 [Radiobacillus kanasensis]|uniref:hypothetical protein n=1 Tax=Radiobacillus kanasensis TaxID=2844358 RepID=UPI001E4C5278|nr:hypothetical protein [Radiobacillus kanasensis]UFT98354.1 hypothetical protein KO561_14245 [Radiobacillus kanasensis]